MREVGGVVDTVQAVVGLVVRRPAQEGQQSVHGPGQVVAAVVLHRQPAVEEVEDGFAQRVAAHQAGAGQSQQQQGEQLDRAGVLGRQGEGHALMVVQLVDAAVEPRNPGGKQTDGRVSLQWDWNITTVSTTPRSCC